MTSPDPRPALDEFADVSRRWLDARAAGGDLEALDVEWQTAREEAYREWDGRREGTA